MSNFIDQQFIHLEVGATSSLKFLRLWQAWRAESNRSRMLHVVALCTGTYDNPPAEAALQTLAEALDAQLWGLLPGFHRLVFEDGQVLLTLCIGDVAKLLRQQRFEADTIDVNTAQVVATDWVYTAKALAKLCKPGGLLTTSPTLNNNEFIEAALTQCGFVIHAGGHSIKASYSAVWLTKKPGQAVVPSTCVVVGAGLAGAAVANSLARRGWTVTVVDGAATAAAGASGLPAGLVVPHTSPDDAVLSRLSRAGVRITLQQTRSLLRHGKDWALTGVLQRTLDSQAGDAQYLPASWIEHHSDAARDWCYPASARSLAAAGLPDGLTTHSQALWHQQAGWIKPAALVKAWLAAPGISWGGEAKVADIQRTDDGWQLRDAAGQLLAQAALVVLSAGYASQALAKVAGTATSDLQAIRGQVTFGMQKDSDNLPPFAVNGHGGLTTAVTTPDGPMWVMGAGYERDVDVPNIKDQDHADNLARLKTLLPRAADALAELFSPPHARGWAGIRCATTNRLPRVGRLVADDSGAGLWLCTGMGSRGLSFAALCAELLAAHLHGEPLPIDSQLANAMAAKNV